MEAAMPAVLEVEGARPARVGRAGVRWVGAALVLGLMVLAMRVAVNFGTEVPPSMDAAYYPAQTRWLMERGRLMYDDLPVYFRVLAVATRVVMWTTGRPIDEAALLASRTVDSLTGVLLAAPLMLLGWRWSRGRAERRGAFGAACAASAAVLSIGPYRMVSDFQKNTLGLVWLACAVCAAHTAMREEKGARAARWWAVTAVFVALAAVTHVGAAGATALVIGLCIAADAVLRKRVSVRSTAAAAAVMALLGGLALGLLYVVEPHRAAKMLRAPVELFQGSSVRRGPGGAGGPGGMRGPRGPGGGGLGGMGELFIPVMAYGAGIAGLIAVWRARRTAGPGGAGGADRAVVFACAAAAMLLACPLISGEYSQRLGLMSLAPAAVALSFAVVRVAMAGSWWRAVVPGVVVGAVSLASLAQGFASPHPPVVSMESLAELRTLRAEIANPARTLVVARHGLEWWAAQVLNTPVRLERAPEDAFEKYDRVLVIQENGVMMGGGPPGRGGRGPGGRGGPEGRGGRGDGGLGFDRPRLFPDTDVDGDDDDGEMDRGPRPMRGGGPPGMMRAMVPRGSVMIHDGKHYRVFEAAPGAEAGGTGNGRGK